MSPKPRNLLVFCFSVDSGHPTLNFALGWYRRLLEHYDGIDIIAFDVGPHDLPSTIRVHQLKKPLEGRALRLLRFWRIASRICRERRPAVVFSHMNLALTVAFWPLSRLFGLRQVLWHTHSHVSPLLRCAVMCTDRVLSASPEGCLVKTGKLRCIGHGVDDRIFAHPVDSCRRIDAVTTGRIARSKNIDLIIEAFVAAAHPTAKLHVIGSPACSADAALEQTLRQRWSGSARVVFHGFRSPSEISAIYSSCALFVNLSDTGSLDKANLEAALAGLAVLTSNAAFIAFVRSHGLPDDLLLTKGKDNISSLMRKVLDMPYPTLNKHAVIGQAVAAEHSLDGLIAKLGGELRLHERVR